MKEISQWEESLSNAREFLKIATTSQFSTDVYDNLAKASTFYHDAIKKYYHEAGISTNKVSRGINSTVDMILEELGVSLIFAGEIYRQTDQFERAMQFLNAAFEYLPREKHPEILRKTSIIKKIRKQFDESLDDIMLAMDIEPEKENEYRYMIGLVHIDQGKYSDALIELRKSVKINPELALAQAHLGDVYLNLQNRDLAVEHYNKALSVANNKKYGERHAIDYNGAIRAENGIGFISREGDYSLTKEAIERKYVTFIEALTFVHFRGDFRTFIPGEPPGTLPRNIVG